MRAQILDGLDEGHRAFIYTNRDLRAEVLRIFDSTFAITYALEIIAIVVAMLGVAATLLTLVLERRRELSMLRLIGAARRQVQRVVVIEAALIGAVSQAIGLVVGLGAVGGAGLRHQRAELRLDHSVPRADAVPGAGLGRGDRRDGGGRHLSRATRGAAGGGS